MICAVCESQRVVGNGNNRLKCLDCNGGRGRSFNKVPFSAEEAEDIALAKRGYAPAFDLNHPTPPGQQIKGVSSLYKPDGSVAMQWVKTTRDQLTQQLAMDSAFAAFGEQLPREKARPAPKQTQAALLNLYAVTDYHFGMLAWGEETGADWDVNIAEALLVDWFSAAIAQAPDADVGVFAQIGDFLHYDGLDAVTPASKHLLDADTRFQKVVRVAIRAVRRIIGMLLEKHRLVHIIQAEGNHDPASSIWLREWLASIYEDEPRVSVDRSPDPYYCYEHGDTSLFFHHGHKRKPNNVDDVFAAKFREVFGRTKFSYAHMGHLHHIDVKETSLMVVEQHRTLAAPDAYASRGGWMSGRDAQVISYHKAYGEVGRVRISSKMLEVA